MAKAINAIVGLALGVGAAAGVSHHGGVNSLMHTSTAAAHAAHLAHLAHVAAESGGGSTAAVTARTVSAPSGGTLTCRGLEDLWESAGGNPAEAFMAAEIATAESSGEENSTMHNTNGTTDVGYWQINSSWGSKLSTYNPGGNAAAAVYISKNGTNWGPWVTYTSGAYEGKC
jgi:hypothetical protein